LLKDILEKLKLAMNTSSIEKLIAYGNIPLDDNMMEELGYYQGNKKAYHISDLKWLKELKKLENKPNQISCFTKGGRDIVDLPILKQSSNSILILLEGNAVIEGKSDLWTAVDKNGKRWLITSTFESGKKLNFFILGIVKKILKKYGYNGETNSQEMENFLNNINKTKEIYKLYIEKLTDFLDEGGYKYLNDFLNSNIIYDYNEVVMDYIKILEVYTINGLEEEIEKECKKLKIPYKGIIEYEKLTNLKI